MLLDSTAGVPRPAVRVFLPIRLHMMAAVGEERFKGLDSGGVVRAWQCGQRPRGV